jgi:hypothetical protein
MAANFIRFYIEEVNICRVMHIIHNIYPPNFATKFRCVLFSCGMGISFREKVY